MSTSLTSDHRRYKTSLPWLTLLMPNEPHLEVAVRISQAPRPAVQPIRSSLAPKLSRAPHVTLPAVPQKLFEPLRRPGCPNLPVGRHPVRIAPESTAPLRLRCSPAPSPAIDHQTAD